MTEKETLLAILEPDCSPDLLVERAGWLARVFDLNVHLEMYEPDETDLLSTFAVGGEVDRYRQRILLSQKELVEEYAETIRAESIDVTTSVLQTRPLGDGILQIADAINPRLVVKATQYHTAAQRSVLLDTDWQLMRHCPYPLWLAKTNEIPATPNIIASIDPCNSHDKPGALDRDIVRTANAVAAAVDGNVHLLHVYERLAGIGRAANRALTPEILPIDEIDARIRDEHRSALDNLAADCGVDAEYVHQLPGRPHEILPAFARGRNAGLVVMGALARWGIKRKIIGSTAERVLDHIPCDLLLVHLFDRQLYDTDG